MSAFGQILGKIDGEISFRPTKNGAIFCTFKVRVQNGSSLEWWDCISFSTTVQEELAPLREGDAVSVTGALNIELFDWKGERRIRRGLTVDRMQVMGAPAKAPKPKGTATAAETAPRPAERRGTRQPDPEGVRLANERWAARNREGDGNDVPF